MSPRYRFGEFTLSSKHRALLRGGEAVALVPRYLDLLLLLVERRHEAVRRREIFDSVWSDVVVSDGALSQAVRTLRRALGDGSREPSFIRTVSRHGYQFVYADVRSEPDEGPLARASARPAARSLEPANAFEAALAVMLDPARDDEERREAAEALHALGTGEALARLGERPGHATARALLRDARWDVPGSGEVPLLRVPGSAAAIRALVALRLRRAARDARKRWAAASAGGALAGLAGGLLGGMALLLAGGGQGVPSVPIALALVGAAIGGLGAAGVGAGLAAAEALARSRRGLALVVLGALGGGTIGALAHSFGRWTLEGLFGHELSFVGGGFEGLLVGAGAGLGYALATSRTEGGGMASPSGIARLEVAAITGLVCGVAFVALAFAGGHLGGVSIDFMARSFQGSQVGLAPIARILGEDELGPRTRAALSAYEGLLFGFGLALGLTRRPRAANGVS